MKYNNLVKGNIKLIRNRRVKKDLERDLNLIKDIMRTLGVSNNIKYTESEDDSKPNINFEIEYYLDMWSNVEDKWNFRDVTSINGDANDLKPRLEKEKQSIILHINYDEIDSSTTTVNNTIEAIISESGMCSLVYQPGKTFNSYSTRSTSEIIEYPETKYLTEADYSPSFVRHIQSFLNVQNVTLGNEFKRLYLYIDYMGNDDDEKRDLVTKLIDLYLDLIPDYVANKDKDIQGALRFKVTEITKDPESRRRDFNITLYITQGKKHIVKTHFKISILQDNVYFAHNDSNSNPAKKEKVVFIFLREYDRIMRISIENSDKAFK